MNPPQSNRSDSPFGKEGHDPEELKHHDKWKEAPYSVRDEERPNRVKRSLVCRAFNPEDLAEVVTQILNAEPSPDERI